MKYKMWLTEPIDACSLILFVARIIRIGEGPDSYGEVSSVLIVIKRI